MKYLIIPHWLNERLFHAKLDYSCLLRKEELGHILTDKEVNLFRIANKYAYFDRLTQPVFAYIRADNEAAAPEHPPFGSMRGYGDEKTVMVDAMYNGTSIYEPLSLHEYTFEPVVVNEDTIGLVVTSIDKNYNLYALMRKVIKVYANYMTTKLVMKTEVFKKYMSRTLPH